jgi:hypothetical protein
MNNYPKQRKPRTTDYSATTQLINSIGPDIIYEMWSSHGMYVTAKTLEREYGFPVSPYVIRYLSHKFNWVRTVYDKNLPFARGVFLGTVPKDFYKHINFEFEDNK